MAKTQEVLLTLASDNVEVIRMEDGRIAVAFDPKKQLRLSKSGKNNLVASTSFSVEGIKVGFNAYRKA